ncbi:MAG: ABC transporter ATP-binding protein [Clostridia bacterium]|nr:ABC transporter ATP-binding protein [Clostridia bacterium]
MNTTVALELKNISKRFGDKYANKNVDLTLNKGEILAILGENGSGKTSMVNMIAGIYYPDEGEIFVDGKPVVITSPKDAFKYKIGMIHQHFKLVDVFSASENIVLGIKEKGRFKMAQVDRKVAEITQRYGFQLDPKKKIHEMSVSEKQTVEIVKVLYRGADILILDEPTAVLTPQEIEKLFDILRRMRDDGKSIIIITHKMNEVLSLSDRVAVMRRGEHIATVETAQTNENELTEMMMGEKVELNIERTEPKNVKDRLVVENICSKNSDGITVLDNISFTARAGEILGVAGIAGSGQRELLEAIAGLYHIDDGKIVYHNPENDEEENLRDKTPLQISQLGVRLSFVPEDRLGMGLVGNMDIVDNVMLRSYKRGKSMFLDRKNPHDLAMELIEELHILTPDEHTPVRRLSGGNIQKVLVGREISAAPSVFMAAYPVRGLDVNASYSIYNLLNRQKELGVAVIFVGEDLDVLLELCDRIMVIASGQVTGIVDARNATKEEIGLLMTAHNTQGGSSNE